MSDTLKKILVRSAVLLVVVGIFAYIFLPSSEEEVTQEVDSTVEVVTDLPETTTTLLIQDPPCLVLYEKDKDTVVMSNNPCVDTYVEKYKANIYSQFYLVCRSSGDGSSSNRNNISEKRMKAFQFELMQKGVPFEIIDSVALGDKSPYPGVDPLSSDGKILNRSCELTAK